MILSLDAAGRLRVDDPFDFRTFSFRDHAQHRIDTPAVEFLAGFAWISEDELRAWAPAAADPAWQSGLTAMIAYARARGWVDETTGRIRAHIEHGDGSANTAS